MLSNEAVFLQALPRLLASGLTLGLASAAASRWMDHRDAELPPDARWCAVTIVVFAMIVGTGIALGAAGVLHDWTWALAVLALSAAMLALERRPDRGAETVATWGPLPARRTPDAPPYDRPSFAFGVAVLGILIGRAVYGLRNPPSDIDSLHYHLPMVGNWIATAGLGLPLREPPAASECYPGNGQLLQLWAAWSTGRETLMPWPGIVSLGVLALALRRLAIDLGARVGIAEAGAVSLACAPGVLQLTFGMRIDNLLAASFAVGLVHALRWRTLGRRLDRDVMLLAIGFLAGLKGTAPAHALLVVLFAVLASSVHRRVGALMRPDLPLLAALLCGGFWLVRNGIATGNPLYPAELRVGPWSFPGVLSRQFLNGTMQLEMWRHGYAGNLTVPHLWTFYGLGNVVIALGALAWLLTEWRRPRTPDAADASALGTARFTVDAWAAPLLVVIAAVCVGLFVISPYSGAFWPAQDGRPPRLAMDNVRYLWPCLVAAFPVAALGLSRAPFPRAWAAAIAAVALALLLRLMGHLLPGMVLAALVLAAGWIVRRFGATRARHVAVVAGAAACLVVAAAVAWVDPLRERLNDTIWDSRHADGSGLDAAAFREVRRVAEHRRIGLVGRVDAWWMCYGRDFTGRPTYVPAAIDWRAEPPRFALRHDDRAHGDSARWLANVARASAAAIVIGALDDTCGAVPIEERWCAKDRSRFTPIAQTACATAFEVNGAAFPPARSDVSRR
jgi:hypothetical protein